MKLHSQLTDATILQELGSRFERQRIEAGLTQAVLAEQAGISKRTLERIEAGHGAELVTIIRLLRALKLIDGLDAVVPQPPASPIALLAQHGKQRLRVKKPRARTAIAAGKPWTWKE